jgi:hypothetical protein
MHEDFFLVIRLDVLPFDNVGMRASQMGPIAPLVLGAEESAGGCFKITREEFIGLDSFFCMEKTKLCLVRAFSRWFVATTHFLSTSLMSRSAGGGRVLFFLGISCVDHNCGSCIDYSANLIGRKCVARSKPRDNIGGGVFRNMVTHFFEEVRDVLDSLLELLYIESGAVVAVLHFVGVEGVGQKTWLAAPKHAGSYLKINMEGGANAFYCAIPMGKILLGDAIHDLYA